MQLFVYGFLGVIGVHSHLTYVAASFEDVSRELGFAVTHVDIQGQLRAKDQEILDALKVNDQPSLLFFNVKQAQRNLEALEKINVARISRNFPNGLKIILEEHKPYALWQHNGEVNVIDQEGRILGQFLMNVDASLPLVIGQGAQIAAAELFATLESFPLLQQRAKAFIRVSDRRWTILMHDGPKIILPAKNMATSLNLLNQLQIKNEILSLDLAYIDMRMKDRLIVMPHQRNSVNEDMLLLHQPQQFAF